MEDSPTPQVLFPGERELLWAIAMDWLTYGIPITSRGLSAKLHDHDVEEKLRQMRTRQIVIKDGPGNITNIGAWRWRLTKKGRQLL